MPRTIFAAILILALFQVMAMAGDLSGAWEYKGPYESGMWLKTRQSGNSIHFQLELQRGSPSYNSGWIEGSIELRHNVGIFHKLLANGGRCEIGFQFYPKRVELRQLGDIDGCSFGAGVRADGVLQRKSYSVPEFSNGDPRFGS